MPKNIVVFVVNFAFVALFSMVMVYFQAAHMSSAEDIANKGLAAVTRENFVFFGALMPAVVGVIAMFVYKRWYASRPHEFFYLAIEIGLGFTVLAAIFFRNAFVEFTALHAVYIMFFGYVMPLMLRAAF